MTPPHNTNSGACTSQVGVCHRTKLRERSGPAFRARALPTATSLVPCAGIPPDRHASAHMLFPGVVLETAIAARAFLEIGKSCVGGPAPKPVEAANPVGAVDDMIVHQDASGRDAPRYGKAPRTSGAKALPLRTGIVCSHLVGSCEKPPASYDRGRVALRSGAPRTRAYPPVSECDRQTGREGIPFPLRYRASCISPRHRSTALRPDRADQQ